MSFQFSNWTHETTLVLICFHSVYACFMLFSVYSFSIFCFVNRRHKWSIGRRKRKMTYVRCAVILTYLQYIFICMPFTCFETSYIVIDSRYILLMCCESIVQTSSGHWCANWEIIYVFCQFSPTSIWCRFPRRTKFSGNGLHLRMFSFSFLQFMKQIDMFLSLPKWHSNICQIRIWLIVLITTQQRFL